MTDSEKHDYFALLATRALISVQIASGRDMTPERTKIMANYIADAMMREIKKS